MCSHTDDPFMAATCREGGGHEAYTEVETTTARSNMEKTLQFIVNGLCHVVCIYMGVFVF